MRSGHLNTLKVAASSKVQYCGFYVIALLFVFLYFSNLKKEKETNIHFMCIKKVETISLLK